MFAVFKLRQARHVSKSNQVFLQPPQQMSSSVPTHNVSLISNADCYPATAVMDQCLKGLLVMDKPTTSYKLMRALCASVCECLP